MLNSIHFRSTYVIYTCTHTHTAHTHMHTLVVHRSCYLLTVGGVWDHQVPLALVTVCMASNRIAGKVGVTKYDSRLCYMNYIRNLNISNGPP